MVAIYRLPRDTRLSVDTDSTPSELRLTLQPYDEAGPYGQSKTGIWVRTDEFVWIRSDRYRFNGPRTSRHCHEGSDFESRSGRTGKYPGDMATSDTDAEHCFRYGNLRTDTGSLFTAVLGYLLHGRHAIIRAPGGPLSADIGYYWKDLQ